MKTTLDTHEAAEPLQRDLHREIAELRKVLERLERERDEAREEAEDWRPSCW